MKNLVLFHEDNDGYCSAAIVKRYMNLFKVKQEDCFFYPINYHKVEKFFDWFEDKADKVEKLIIVDFSFGENWKRLLDKISLLRIIWIDHHKNAI
jgi:oligoribonuclease NrnB/cAMP/cGMP phosphodiesterase (DHH superfamily)